MSAVDTQRPIGGKLPQIRTEWLIIRTATGKEDIHGNRVFQPEQCPS